ncbi:hypothetical protein AFK69_16265 [Xenorhabdus sp. GDc328]|nr:hypothetical protein AFK69_16265 [Xenorhabdus sp. GDc328]
MLTKSSVRRLTVTDKHRQRADIDNVLVKATFHIDDGREWADWLLKKTDKQREKSVMTKIDQSELILAVLKEITRQHSGAQLEMEGWQFIEIIKAANLVCDAFGGKRS